MEPGLIFASALILGLAYVAVSTSRMWWRLLVLVVVVSLSVAGTPRSAFAQESTTTTTTAPLDAYTLDECAQVAGTVAFLQLSGIDPAVVLTSEQMTLLGLMVGQLGAGPLTICSLAGVQGQIGGAIAFLDERDQTRTSEIVAAIESIEPATSGEAVSQEFQNAVIAASVLLVFVGGSMWVRGFARG